MALPVADDVVIMKKLVILRIKCVLWVNREIPHFQISEAFDDC